MRRTISGWFLGITGFLACPCHMVITLPLAAALLSGTALGGGITTHQGPIVIGASIYFIGALAAGATLLLAGKGALSSTAGQRPEGPGDRARSTIGAECCPPAGFPAVQADDIADERADTAPAGGAGGAEIARR